jgi:hypothetical protein
MRSFALTVVVLATVGVRAGAQSADSVAPRERHALDDAVVMAGLQFARLPIVLTSSLPSTATRGAEAWTVYDGDGKATAIVVYTRSRTFRCSSAERPEYRCRLKLASIIVHEAWHVTHGPDEAAAYLTQQAFLEFHNATPLLITEIRQARNRVLAGNTVRQMASSSR